MKKFISILSAVSIASAMLPTYAFSAESGTCGENITWSLDDNGTLTISGTGEMEDYERPEANRPPAKWTSKIPWKWYISNIKSIVVEEGVTSIGEYTVRSGTTALEGDAFYANRELESVILPDTVEYIGGFAFGMCKKLKSIHIPNSVTEIDIYAFNGCESLESIYIPASTEYIGKRAFKACDSLKNIYYEGNKEQWYPLIDNNEEFLDDVVVHFNCEPIENPVTPEPDNTIEDTIINYDPEFIVNPVDGGYILDLNIHKTDYCSKVIAAHYKDGKLINVETKAPTSPIVSFNIAADTDEVKVWTFKDKLEYADAVDVKFLTMVLNDTK